MGDGEPLGNSPTAGKGDPVGQPYVGKGYLLPQTSTATHLSSSPVPPEQQEKEAAPQAIYYTSSASNTLDLCCPGALGWRGLWQWENYMGRSVQGGARALWLAVSREIDRYTN